MDEIRKFVHIYSGAGLGYAKSTTEELKFIVRLAEKSGVMLDPVYSGKVCDSCSNFVILVHVG
jgi:D-cysteine desulfhydrase